eukprot:gene29740-36835_t
MADAGNNRVRKLGDFAPTVTPTALPSVAPSFYLASLSICGDTANNLYVAVADSHTINVVSTDTLSGGSVIRKINLLSNKISLIAGTGGSPGFSGDGGPATAAQFTFPRQLHGLTSDLLLVADFNNNRVRMVTLSSGLIVTYAGSGVSGFAPTVYLATQSVITTVAGNGTGTSAGDGRLATSATLYTPPSVWCDSISNMFVSEYAGQKVRKVDRASGIISTIATFTGGLAQIVGDTNGGLYSPTAAPSQPLSSLSQITTLMGTGSALSLGDLGSATGASLNSPFGVWKDTAGNVYVSEYAGHRIRKIDTLNIVSTYVGTGTAGVLGNNGKATSAMVNQPCQITGNTAGTSLYFVSSDGGTVRAVSLSTNIVTLVAGVASSAAGTKGDNGPTTSASFSSSKGVYFDTSGNMYISESSGNVVRKVSTLGIITAFAGGGAVEGSRGPATSSVLQNPLQIFVTSGGMVLFADSGMHTLRTCSPTTGIIVTFAGVFQSTALNDVSGPATSTKLYYPQGVVVDALGVVYYGEGGTGNGANPVSRPTSRPSSDPSRQPSGAPFKQTLQPTTKPSVEPSWSPSTAPQASPSSQPSVYPVSTSVSPSSAPLSVSSTMPSEAPTWWPSGAPSISPSVSPSTCPSDAPSVTPSAVPSRSPSQNLTASPSVAPTENPVITTTVMPTEGPSFEPSQNPSAEPTVSPSPAPSASPSVGPSQSPSDSPSETPTCVPKCGAHLAYSSANRSHCGPVDRSSDEHSKCHQSQCWREH